jgi:hypothetical protein
MITLNLPLANTGKDSEELNLIFGSEHEFSPK